MPLSSSAIAHVGATNSGLQSSLRRLHLAAHLHSLAQINKHRDKQSISWPSSNSVPNVRPYPSRQRHLCARMDLSEERIRHGAHGAGSSVGCRSARRFQSTFGFGSLEVPRLCGLTVRIADEAHQATEGWPFGQEPASLRSSSASRRPSRDLCLRKGRRPAIVSSAVLMGVLYLFNQTFDHLGLIFDAFIFCVRE